MRIVFQLVLTALLFCALPANAITIPRAVIEDPAPNAQFPARLEVIHVPTGGVDINGIVYVAAGPGAHPTLVFFNGLPGNERNLDVAQAARRAGWNVVTINYRGSWGSPGKFSFAQNLEDARATLAFVRDPANAKRLNVDPAQLAVGGHSMGGWVAAQTLAADSTLLGGIIISAGDFGGAGQYALQNRAAIVSMMNDNRESLAGVTAETMTDELAAHGTQWSFATLAPQTDASPFEHPVFPRFCRSAKRCPHQSDSTKRRQTAGVNLCSHRPFLVGQTHRIASPGGHLVANFARQITAHLVRCGWPQIAAR